MRKYGTNLGGGASCPESALQRILSCVYPAHPVCQPYVYSVPGFFILPSPSRLTGDYTWGMGTEYLIVNYDKREILDFDPLGFNTKRNGITSAPFSSFLCWLLMKHQPEEGYENLEWMGHWAGDRIAIVGDANENDQNDQDRFRGEFHDVTIDTIKEYAQENPFETLTEFQPMGLIDEQGTVVTDEKKRTIVAAYWKEKNEQVD
jgi:hypothetical protein